MYRHRKLPECSPGKFATCSQVTCAWASSWPLCGTRAGSPAQRGSPSPACRSTLSVRFLFHQALHLLVWERKATSPNIILASGNFFANQFPECELFFGETFSPNSLSLQKGAGVRSLGLCSIKPHFKRGRKRMFCCQEARRQGRGEGAHLTKGLDSYPHISSASLGSLEGRYLLPLPPRGRSPRPAVMVVSGPRLSASGTCDTGMTQQRSTSQASGLEGGLKHFTFSAL